MLLCTNQRVGARTGWDSGQKRARSLPKTPSSNALQGSARECAAKIRTTQRSDGLQDLALSPTAIPWVELAEAGTEFEVDYEFELINNIRG